MTAVESATIAQDVKQADLFEQSWHLWQSGRQETLAAPHNYLAPTSITWLAEGESTQVDDFPGTWNVENDAIIYTPAAGAEATTAGHAITAPLAFTPDAYGEQDLGFIDDGDLRAEVNSQTDASNPNAHRFWVRIKDPNAQSRKNFHGIEHFDVNEKWVLPATFTPATGDELDEHDSVVSNVLQAYKVLGTLEFEYEGAHYSLIVSNVFGHASIFFQDATTGGETAGIGRVLELSAADVLGLETVDFNRAFNYPCSFSQYCTCPIPSKRNRLPFAVAAGEKTPFESR
jgi:uncharacterized protein (DUF1684 family)